MGILFDVMQKYVEDTNTIMRHIVVSVYKVLLGITSAYTIPHMDHGLLTRFIPWHLKLCGLKFHDLAHVGEQLMLIKVELVMFYRLYITIMLLIGGTTNIWMMVVVKLVDSTKCRFFYLVIFDFGLWSMEFILFILLLFL